MAFCTVCGAEVKEGANFCGRCGQPTTERSPVDLGSDRRSTPHDEAAVAPARTTQQTTTPAAEHHQLSDLKKQIAAYQKQLAVDKRRYASLKQALSAVEEAVEIQSYGFYEQRYGLESSEEYKPRIEQCRSEQKQLIKSGAATEYPTNWMVDGSLAKGKQMLSEHAKLMLRAFNGECDAAIAKVSYRNVTTLQKRIEKSFTEINKLGAAKKTRITERYGALKLSELFLVHEHREKLQEEKETQRQIKAEMLEEARAEREIAEAQEKAEEEERLYREALEKANRDLVQATDDQHSKLQALVEKLERELSAAIDRKAKGIARAQLTRSGHVYVLSNVGSFGKDIYKIGMTRRFEPLERIYELGDASVPFRFDVHAVIYSEDAPALESKLHREFEARRVNRVNFRREYFRVTLSEIQSAVEKFHGVVSFVTVPQAEEYEKTIAMESATQSLLAADSSNAED